MPAWLGQENPRLIPMTHLGCPCRSPAYELRIFREPRLAPVALQTAGRPFLKSQEALGRPAQRQPRHGSAHAGVVLAALRGKETETVKPRTLEQA